MQTQYASKTQFSNLPYLILYLVNFQQTDIIKTLLNTNHLLDHMKQLHNNEPFFYIL